MAQITGHFQNGGTAAQEDGFPIANKFSRGLANALFVFALPGFSLQDRRLRRSLSNGLRSTVKSLDTPLLGQCVEVAPDCG
jgi:hypothetical protein